MESQFVGVFPADKKGGNFIRFSNDLKGKNRVSIYDSKYRSGKKPGVHWWSFLDREEKDTLFLFDSFGSHGLLHFVVENDLPTFNKLIPGQLKQIFKKDNKITLLKWSFKLSKYEKLKEKELNKLSDTARHFFRFLYEVGKYKGVKNTVQVVMVDDNLQSHDTDYCGPFQMYF